jgi:hypothetical protein
MNFKLAVEVLENGGIALGIGERQVSLRSSSVRQNGGYDREIVAARCIDRFFDPGKIVQVVLLPGTNRDQELLRFGRVTIVGLGEVENVGNETFLVEPVDIRSIVGVVGSSVCWSISRSFAITSSCVCTGSYMPPPDSGVRSTRYSSGP